MRSYGTDPGSRSFNVKRLASRQLECRKDWPHKVCTSTRRATCHNEAIAIVPECEFDM